METCDAALVVELAVAAELEPEAVVELEAVPVLDAAPEVGAPKVLTPVGIGPTGADAEAPTPTKFPTLCTGVAVTASAAAWKEEKVFPLAGALMAPTIPAAQWGEGRSCLQ